MCLCIGADTCIVLYQLLYSVKLGPRGDVVATVVEFANLVMLDVVPFVVIPVTDRQRVSTCEESEAVPLVPPGVRFYMYMWFNTSVETV